MSDGGLGRLARPVPMVLLGTLIAIAATWPTLPTLGTATMTDPVEPDFQVGLWWPSFVADSLLHLRSPFFDPALAWPNGQDITEMGIGFGWVSQLWALPVHAVTDPLTGLDLVTLLTMLLNGLCCAWAGRAVTRSPVGALTGLVVGCTSAYAFVEAGYGRPEQAEWGPVALYFGALARLDEAPGERRTRWIGAAGLGLAGMIYPFYAYFAGLLTLLALPLWLRRRQTLLDLVFIGAVAAVAEAIVIFPVLLHFWKDDHVFRAIATGGGDQQRAKMNASVILTGFLGPFSWGRGYVYARVPLLLGPAAAWASVRAPRAVRAVAVMALLAAVFAAGPMLVGDGGAPIRFGTKALVLPSATLDHLPGFWRMWWPYRWLGVLTPALAIVVAWAMDRLRAGAGTLVGFTIGCTVACAVTARSGLSAGQSLRRPVEVPAVFEQLAAAPPAPILMVPSSRLLNGMVGWQAFHHQPISSGVCWHMPGLQGTVPGTLLPAVESVLRGGPATQRAWTPEETGGFQQVMLRKDPVARGDEVQRLSTMLGAPVYEDDQLALWTVPGP